MFWRPKMSFIFNLIIFAYLKKWWCMLKLLNIVKNNLMFLLTKFFLRPNSNVLVDTHHKKKNTQKRW